MKKGIFILFILFFSLSCTSAATIFSDGFESGTLSGWILSAMVNNTNWTANTTDPYQGLWHAQARPLDNSPKPANTMEHSVSTIGYQNITFSYYRKLIGFDMSGDEFQVEWYNGTAWTEVEDTPEIPINDSTYVLMSFNLPASANNNLNFKIKFECSANAMNEYCRVDDVVVTGNQISVIPQNYHGYITYLPGYDYHFVINDSTDTIAFSGLNTSNQYDYYTIPFNVMNNFVKRINYVWFNGWFDTNNLYLNQYVGTGAVYYALAYELSPAIYSGQLTLPNSVYLGITSPIGINVTIDVGDAKSTIDPGSIGMETTSYIDNTWGAAGHAYGPVLYQTRLVVGNNQTMIEVSEWVKYDLATNGLNATWVSPLSVL